MLSFFIGKGGVGKTTISAACAAHLAAVHPRQRVLLISTDPAHSLLDVFGMQKHTSAKFSKPQSLDNRKNLFVWQIDAQKEFEKFVSRYREAILEIVEQGTIFTREEIAPLLSTTLPGMAEFAALLAISDALSDGRFHQIVVDTAPFGHTLRLFELPQHFQRFLEFLDLAGGRDQVLAAHFGGHSETISGSFLREWELIVARVTNALGSPESRVVLVTTPESFSLNEAVRVSRQLQEGPARLAVRKVVVNRALPRAESKCARCVQRPKQTKNALSFLKKSFAGIPVLLAYDSASPVLGVEMLTRFGGHIFAKKPAPAPVQPPTREAAPGFSPVKWPELHAPLTFTLGKGGVGKTTVSSALAFHHRRRHHSAEVLICSTDPAPSLDDIFQQAIGDKPAAVLRDNKFLAAEFDAVAEYSRWAARMRRQLETAFRTEPSSGVHVDLSFERRVFSALLDIVPPGVDELFAVLRILDMLAAASNTGRIVIDMAPTGHALELLRMPDRMLVWSRLLLKMLAGHRALPLAQDIAVEIASVSQRVRELAALLKNSAQSGIVVVLLAEPHPDRETVRLLNDLTILGTPSPAIFVNRVFLEEHSACARCDLARAWQSATLAGLPERLHASGRLYVVPEQRSEPTGRAGLQSLTRKLWQLEPARVRDPKRVRSHQSRRAR